MNLDIYISALPSTNSSKTRSNSSYNSLIYEEIKRNFFYQRRNMFQEINLWLCITKGTTWMKTKSLEITQNIKWGEIFDFGVVLG